MAINILVIDDDRKMAERLMRSLQRADKENVLGEIQVDDSVIKLETVENYDISHFETTFLSKETSCNESKTDLHADMLKTMYEMVTTLVEQTVLMIDEEIHKLNILMEKHSGSDEE